MIVFGSARGAPGATTAALAVASWLDDGVLIEADSAGGVLALRYGLGREPGLATLIAARGSGELLDHAQRLPGGLPVVVGPESASRATHLWRTGGAGIARATTATDHTVVVDVGRLLPDSPARGIVATADRVAVVCRPEAEQLIAAADILHGLRGDGAQAGLVLVGEGPYSRSDVSAQLGCRVHGVLADDQRGAAALASPHGSRALARSALLRSARSLAATLTDSSAAPPVRVHRGAQQGVSA